jgi:hypothetical protein
MKDKWIYDKNPAHKDSVICQLSTGHMVPAVYFDNSSFKGFYKFSDFYQSEDEDKVIYNLKLKDKHIIEGVNSWVPFPNK